MITLIRTKTLAGLRSRPAQRAGKPAQSLYTDTRDWPRDTTALEMAQSLMQQSLVPRGASYEIQKLQALQSIGLALIALTENTRPAAELSTDQQQGGADHQIAPAGANR